ncbi:uncharacterized protein LOC129600907 isoform X2 [Paramacrobiotus metropolitanus]|uniref:uncharacterized protein LOC129600907 isoform X2 n=1 Tax=Paramacrobiotus metropolitanus TaxID=2943436 RepID=UPI0024460921|nr:uncharacterized protein LOC129600907 isoform X2 [Paramacrobiotus metropolitanus]
MGAVKFDGGGNPLLYEALRSDGGCLDRCVKRNDLVDVNKECQPCLVLVETRIKGLKGSVQTIQAAISRLSVMISAREGGQMKILSVEEIPKNGDGAESNRWLPMRSLRSVILKNGKTSEY